MLNRIRCFGGNGGRSVLGGKGGGITFGLGVESNNNFVLTLSRFLVGVTDVDWVMGEMTNELDRLYVLSNRCLDIVSS